MRINNVMWDQNTFSRPPSLSHLPDKVLQGFRNRMRLLAYKYDVVTYKFDKEIYAKTGKIVRID